MSLTSDQLKLRDYILQGVVERIECCYGKPASPLKAGAKREELALNYVIGATKALLLVDNEMGQYFERMLVYVFSVRGTYAESVAMLAETAKNQNAA